MVKNTFQSLECMVEVEGMFEHAEVTNGFAKVSCLLATLLSGLVHPPVG